MTDLLLPRRILGVDPGLQRTGFGVLEQRGAKLVYLSSGVIRVPVKLDLPARLRVVFEGLRQVVAEFSPTEACVEKVFVNVNPHSTLLLGQARGTALVALATAGLAVAEYTPGQIKQAVTGTGRATKEQVQHMMVRLLSLPTEPSKDAADALACAVCHAHGGALLGALGGAARAGGAQLSPVERLMIESGRDATGGVRPQLGGARGMRVRRGRLVAS